MKKHIGFIPNGDKSSDKIINYIKNIFDSNIYQLTILICTKKQLKEDGTYPYLRSVIKELKEYIIEKNIKVTICGEKSQLPLEIEYSLTNMENETFSNEKHKLNLVIGYTKKDEIARSIRMSKKNNKSMININIPTENVMVRHASLRNLKLMESAPEEKEIIKVLAKPKTTCGIRERLWEDIDDRINEVSSTSLHKNLYIKDNIDVIYKCGKGKDHDFLPFNTLNSRWFFIENDTEKIDFNI